MESILRWKIFPQGGDKEKAIIFPVLWQQRSAWVLFVADAKGHTHTSLLTVDLSTCFFFLAPFLACSLWSRTNHLTLDKLNSCLPHDSGPKWPLDLCHLCQRNSMPMGWETHATTWPGSSGFQAFCLKERDIERSFQVQWMAIQLWRGPYWPHRQILLTCIQFNSTERTTFTSSQVPETHWRQMFLQRPQPKGRHSTFLTAFHTRYVRVSLYSPPSLCPVDHWEMQPYFLYIFQASPFLSIPALLEALVLYNLIGLICSWHGSSWLRPLLKYWRTHIMGVARSPRTVDLSW